VIPRRSAVVTLLIVVLGLSGCTVPKPAGTDGDLLNGWPAVPIAQYDTPKASLCYDLETQDVPCTESHDLEIAKVETLTGAAAQRSDVPAAPDPDFAAARVQCAQDASAYLGGDYRGARAYLRVGMPNQHQWDGGDRAYVCELGVNDDSYLGNVRDSVLKDGLTGARTAAIGCTMTNGKTLDKDTTYADVSLVHSVDCAQSHDSEYVGALDPVSEALPTDSAAEHNLFGSRCESLIAAFLGVSVSQYHKRPDLYTMWWWRDARTWAEGDHGIQCFVVLTSAKRTTGSLKGHGTKRVG
jgi:hypothetical protein